MEIIQEDKQRIKKKNQGIRKKGDIFKKKKKEKGVSRARRKNYEGKIREKNWEKVNVTEKKG